MMRVSYEPGLEKLALALEEYGHELFPLTDLQECDAVLFIDHVPQANPGKNGALFIHAGKQNAENLNRILQMRLYSELF